MDVDTKEFWQSEPLTQLYFDEKEGISFYWTIFATIYKDLNMKKEYYSTSIIGRRFDACTSL
jgi:hypothetical protein